MEKNLVEDYCSYELAKLLKEKGFNIEVGGMYVNKDNNFVHASIAPLKVKDYEKVWDDQFIPTCTHQMAMKFLRNVYDIHISVNKTFLINDIDNKPYLVYVCTKKCHTSYNAWSEYHSTYEEAVDAALKYVLKNLI